MEAFWRLHYKMCDYTPRVEALHVTDPEDALERAMRPALTPEAEAKTEASHVSHLDRYMCRPH